MSGLVDSVMSQLGDAQIQQIAGKLGVDPATARNAIEHALPLIVGGMAKSASTDAGAGALHNALGDHAGNSVSDVLNSVLSGAGANSGGLGGMLSQVLGGTNGTSGVGGAILGRIFGGNAHAANQGLGQTTGLGTQNAAQLLAILAPIVMSVLANQTRSQGLSPGGLGGVLAQQGQQIQQRGGLAGGLLNAVLDHNGDGKIDLSDLIAGAGGLMNAMNHHA